MPDVRKAVGASQAFYISQFASNPGVEPQPCSAFALGGGTFLPLLQCVPSSALLSGRHTAFGRNVGRGLSNAGYCGFHPGVSGHRPLAFSAPQWSKAGKVPDVRKAVGAVQVL